MSEHDELSEKLEREADAMGRASDALGDHIEDARSDFQTKQNDPGVPGADPDDHVLAELAGDEDESDEDEA